MPASQSFSTQTQMLREIHEQPAALQQAISGAADVARRIAQEVARREVDVILIAARGTSDHAGLYAQYLLQYLTGIPVVLATPSLFTVYGGELRLRRALVIGISQSGEAPDVLEVIKHADRAGALTIGVTNIAGSPLATIPHETLFCSAGLERSVAATKTYTTTCAVLASLAAAFPGGEMLRDALPYVPDLVASALRCEERISQIALRYVHARDCVVLGRGFQYSTARETALKLEETCYMVTTPFSTADFRHGPAAVVERGMPTILFAPPGRTAEESAALLRMLRERGADCLAVGQDEALLAQATVSINLRLPALSARQPDSTGRLGVDELLAPISYIIPGQLLAHYVALHKGLDPDHPRGLTKITHTR